MSYLRRRDKSVSRTVVFSLFLLAGSQPVLAAESGQIQRLENLSAPRNQNPLGASQPCGSEVSKRPSDSLSTSGQPRQHAQACLIKVDAAIDAFAKGRMTIIDTRTANEFNKYRIPGSLNMPTHAVKTKAFLKPQAFLLVNESHTAGELERVCSDLRRDGYSKASVLQGGLFSWQAHGGMVDGDTIAARTLSAIYPSELIQEQPFKDWLIIDVSNRKNLDVKKYFPGVVSIPWTRDHKNEKALLTAMNGAGNKRILVVDETSDSYAGIASRIAVQRKDVLYLDGGLRRYVKYQREQVAMWKQRDEPSKRKGCST